MITTGGGFSTFYKQPSWQTEAVDGYFNSLSSNEIPVDGFNRLGRGYPDISFVGIKYQVVIANIIFNLYGTSCSAPVAAALGKSGS